MDLNEFFFDHREMVLSKALRALDRTGFRHYQSLQPDQTRERLAALYDITQGCVVKKNASRMLAHVLDIAKERYDSGFSLGEVQTAFNVLEEAIWLQALEKLPPEDFVAVLGPVGTVLGLGKDELAREYLSLATGNKVPPMNQRALFAGTDGS